MEVELEQEPAAQTGQPESLSVLAAVAFAQALENAQAAGEPVIKIATAVVNEKNIKAAIIKDEGKGQLLVIIAESESIETTTLPENGVLLKNRRPTAKSRRTRRMQAAQKSKPTQRTSFTFPGSCRAG